jgi:hypothetical protein
MRRVPLVVGLFALLLVCGVVAYLASPSAGEAPPRVHFEMDAPKRALLREPTDLEVRVQNLGTVPIRDLGVKINRGYANVFTITRTRPLAQIDDASTERRLYFGPVEPGESKAFRITMSPQRTGDFSLTLRLVAARRGFDPQPLTDATTGAAELTAVTSVLER